MTMGINKIEYKSKCASKTVVAEIYDPEGNLLSVGFNGTLPGLNNCNELFKKMDGLWYKKVNGAWVYCVDQKCHHNWSKQNEVHAEINAIHKAYRNVNGGLDECSIKISHSPCSNCSLNIAIAGITKVQYLNEYEDDSNGIKLLQEYGVKVEKIDSWGD